MYILDTLGKNGEWDVPALGHFCRALMRRRRDRV